MEEKFPIKMKKELGFYSQPGFPGKEELAKNGG
jgi:hypothetical protein